MATSVVLHISAEPTQLSMMAWCVHEFGRPDVMRFEQVLRPTPGHGEVLVKVEAAGVGPWDAWIRAGKSALPQPLPLTPGSDLSGDIVAVGRRFLTLRVGDQVYGVTNRCPTAFERTFRPSQQHFGEKAAGWPCGGEREWFDTDYLASIRPTRSRLR
jgi:NADPH:quinone reductase-like Zn-dependent oxidoreductase